MVSFVYYLYLFISLFSDYQIDDIEYLKFDDSKESKYFCPNKAIVYLNFFYESF